MGFLDVIEKIISILIGLIKLINVVLKISKNKSKKDPSESLQAADEPENDDAKASS